MNATEKFLAANAAGAFFGGSLGDRFGRKYVLWFSILGALPFTLKIVEERTVGPSLGADNIALGLRSIQIGSLLVIGFMLLVYRVFGIFAILAFGSCWCCCRAFR